MIEEIKTNLLKKNLSDSSINLYLRNLRKLNDNKPISNLNFLKKPDITLEKIKDLKDNTKRGYLIGIVSILKDLPTYKPLYKKYYNLMIEINNKINKIPTEDKTATQSKNWIEWDEVIKVYNNLLLAKIPKGKWDLEQYNDYLNILILSLYTLIPVRRNKDYLEMMIIFNNNTTNTKYNYLDVNNKQFIFNNYKTSKIETKKNGGPLIINIPDNLMNIINIYLNHYPLKFNKKDKNIQYPFLVDYEGLPINKVNSITRILNKIFKKNVSSSILRHSYLSSKYSNVLKEQEQDAKMMSHGLQTQKDYIKI